MYKLPYPVRVTLIVPQLIMTLFDSLEHLYMMGNPKGVRDFKALEKRRFEAMRLLDQGHNQSETARRLKVARQTVSAWRNTAAGCGRTPPGRARRTQAAPRCRTTRTPDVAVAGRPAHGFPTPLWSSAGGRLIGDEFGVERRPRLEILTT